VVWDLISNLIEVEEVVEAAVAVAVGGDHVLLYAEIIMDVEETGDVVDHALGLDQEIGMVEGQADLEVEAEIVEAEIGIVGILEREMMVTVEEEEEEVVVVRIMIVVVMILIVEEVAVTEEVTTIGEIEAMAVIEEDRDPVLLHPQEEEVVVVGMFEMCLEKGLQRHLEVTLIIEMSTSSFIVYFTLSIVKNVLSVISLLVK
jgi:hypothetical protein